ncbi:copper-binding protein [Brevundimonas sp.]|uniref:copper-binding protein n=1 Tax=Brevundimonas sp. TaxID=1871086 RepID=UPI002ED841B3
MKHALILSAGLAIGLGACNQKTEPAPVEAPAAAPATSGDMAATPMASAEAVKSGVGTGVITKVDAAAGSVTIDHGPIPGVDWPAMTMSFKAAPTVVEKAKVGERVQFDVTVRGRESEVTAIRPE